MNTDDKPLATIEYEEWMRDIFPLEMSPEEYVARHAHQWGCFSGANYSYRDARLQAWIYRFYQIMVEPGAQERCRKQFLSVEEIEQIHKEESNPDW